MVECNGEKIAIEIKSRNDDAIRRLAELAVAKAYGYNNCILVTTKRKAHVDSKGQIHFRV